MPPQKNWISSPLLYSLPPNEHTLTRKRKKQQQQQQQTQNAKTQSQELNAKYKSKKTRSENHAQTTNAKTKTKKTNSMQTHKRKNHTDKRGSLARALLGSVRVQACCCFFFCFDSVKYLLKGTPRGPWNSARAVAVLRERESTTTPLSFILHLTRKPSGILECARGGQNQALEWVLHGPTLRSFICVLPFLRPMTTLTSKMKGTTCRPRQLCESHRNGQT